MGRRYAQGEVFYPFFVEPTTSVTSVDLLIIRGSDGFYLDFNDSTFKDSTWTTKEQGLTEKTEGVWVWTTGWTIPSADETYRAIYKDDSGAVYEGSEIQVGAVPADVIEISGDSTAADNIEATYDGTGYTEDSAPAKQSQLANLSNVGSAVHRPAVSYTLTTGTQSANTVSETEALDSIRHEHTDDTGVMELYYEFNIGSGTPSSVQVTGYITGGNDDLDVYGYDWVAAGWVQIGNIQGGGSTSNSVNSFDMFVDMVGSGVNSGVVRVRFFKASGLTSALLAVDQIFVAFNQGVSGYENAAIWYNSNITNTNTVVGVDGTSTNPVSSEAAVNTLLASTNLSQVEVIVGSSITFATAHNGETWRGHNWTLALGGQDVGGSHFFGAEVSGIGTGSAQIDFHDGVVGTCTLDPFHSTGCGFDGTVTFGSAGDYIINDGHSAIAGSSTPIIDTGAAIANVNLAMPDWHNGIEIRNLNNAGTDLFSISGIGQIIYAASSSGTVQQRGSWKVTNTGGVTINEDDNTANIAAILVDTGTDGVALSTAAITAILTTTTTTSLIGLPTNLSEMVYWSIQNVRNKLKYIKATDVMELFEDDNTAKKFTHTMIDDATEATRGKGA